MGLVVVVFDVGVPHDTTDDKESEEEEEKCEREVLGPRALPHATSSHCSFLSNLVFDNFLSYLEKATNQIREDGTIFS